MPLFTLAQVQNTLTNYLAATTGTHNIQVFTEFPSNENVISEGVYAARAYQADRNKNSNGIRPGGHVYTIRDRLEMYVITQQVNPYVENELGIFQKFIDDPLFIDYYLREHSIDQQYVNNSERYRVIFDLHRLQVI
jgi:hypothetical protein